MSITLGQKSQEGLHQAVAPSSCPSWPLGGNPGTKGLEH
jgi:hypothetical protein